MRTPPPVLPPDDDTPAAYHPTLLDRHGPDAMLHVRAAAAGVMTLPLSAGVLMLTGVGRALGPVGVLVLALATGYFVYWLTLRTVETAGDVTRAFTMPSGKTTPYEEQFSYQEAMAARGDVAGALESYEAVIAERPGQVAPRLRAAELYALRGGNPARAAELFREVRDLRGVEARHAVYASSRLVDLYDGPLDEPGRALVELRRIIERHPRAPIAHHAREALPRLKSRLAAAQGDTLPR